jgi:uncharacterized protein (DUF433 family)
MVAKSLDRFSDMTPGVMGGVPRIAGHRVRVSDVAIWHERMKWDAERIVEEIGLTPRSRFITTIARKLISRLRG